MEFRLQAETFVFEAFRLKAELLQLPKNHWAADDR